MLKQKKRFSGMGSIYLTGLLGVSGCNSFTQPEINPDWDLGAQGLNCGGSLSEFMQAKGQMRSKHVRPPEIGSCRHTEELTSRRWRLLAWRSQCRHDRRGRQRKIEHFISQQVVLLSAIPVLLIARLQISPVNSVSCVIKLHQLSCSAFVSHSTEAAEGMPCCASLEPCSAMRCWAILVLI